MCFSNIICLKEPNANLEEVSTLNSLKPNKRNTDSGANLEELMNTALPLLASVLPDLMNSLKSDGRGDGSNRFNLDKLMNMLPTLMMLLPGLLNSANNNTSLDLSQLQELLPSLTNPGRANPEELKEQAAKALPVLTKMLQDLSGDGGNDLTDQLNQLISGLGLNQ